jgi:GSCFA family
VHYFASYEIISGTANTSTYFGEDRRTVTQAGIEHVMTCFFDLYSDDSTLTPLERSNDRTAMSPRDNSVVSGAVCDEKEFFRALAAADGVSRIGGN